MTVEANDIETPAIEVEGTPVPDVTPAVETPVETPEAEAPAAEPTDIEIYQEILAKDEASPDTYEMTESDLVAFDSVQAKIASGEIKDPGLKTETEAPKDEPKAEEKPKAEETPANKEPETPKETDPETSDITVKQGDSIQEAMGKLGAKDVNQLPEKIDLLLKGMKESGGKLGTANVALQSQVDQNINFMQSLKAGDPSAVAHFNKLMGKQIMGEPAEQVPLQKAQVADLPAEFDPEEFLDNKLAPIVQSLMGKMKVLEDKNVSLEAKDTGRELTAQQTVAVTAWIDDVVRIVGQNPDDFGMTVAEARGLATTYWTEKGAKDPIHPSFQKMHDLISYSANNNMPNLDTAHIALQQKNGSFAQKLIDAEKRGADKASHTVTPNLAISAKQGRTKQGIPDPTVTEDMIHAMAAGDLNAIPESVYNEWTDEGGTFLRNKVPERFHATVFGGGKI